MIVRQGVTGGKAETELHVGHCAKIAFQLKYYTRILTCVLSISVAYWIFGISEAVLANVLPAFNDTHLHIHQPFFLHAMQEHIEHIEHIDYDIDQNKV